jgi:hypothetical protein
MDKIALGKSANVVINQVTVSSLTLRQIMDMPQAPKVVAIVDEIPRPIVLWEGDEYREWTKADVSARLIELAGNGAITFADQQGQGNGGPGPFGRARVQG